MIIRPVSLFAVVALVAALLLPCASSASDWTQFRGPHFDGTAEADWPDDPRLRLKWRHPLGTGYSGIVVADGRVYASFGDAGEEWLAAFDAATGDELWRLGLGAETPPLAGGHGGPSATPTVGAGLVFALGGFGRLVAANSRGEAIWVRELAEFAAPTPWGFTSSPLVVEGEEGAVLLVQTQGKDGKILFALDPVTGRDLWSQVDESSFYQSPVLLRLAGRDQIVVAGLSSLFGLDLAGERLWTFDLPAFGPPTAKGRQINVPLRIAPDRLMVKVSPDETIGVDVRATESGYEAELAWRGRGFGRSYVPSVAHDGLIYGYRGTLISAVDAGTGEVVWRSRSPGDGFLTVADDRIVVLTKRGGLHLSSTGREGWAQQAELHLFDDAAWTEPTVADDAIFVRSIGELARVELHAADAEVGDDWIDTTLAGAALPETNFGRFVRSLRTSEDRVSAVDAFLEEVESFPIVEGEWAHFVYRGDEQVVGIAGDMVGERDPFEMVKVPGTDLFYFSSKLPRDAEVSYAFYPEATEQGVLDPLNPRTTFWPREGSEFDLEMHLYSRFRMPDAETPSYLLGEPERAGGIETHELELSGLGVEVKPPLQFSQFVADEPPQTQRIRVYLPADHDASRAEPYPAVFVFAGDKVLEGLDARRTLDHLLGDELPASVVVFVDRNFEFLNSDSAWAFELHRRSLFELILPLVRERYNVGETHYLGFGYGGPMVLRTALAEESEAERIAMIQPFVLDIIYPSFVAGIDQVPVERRPRVYMETSRIDMRGAHETWDIGVEHKKVAKALADAGWGVQLETNSCGYFWSAWKDRLGPALAFLLTGEARVPDS